MWRLANSVQFNYEIFLLSNHEILSGNETLLLNIDGASHSTYMHDEAEGYRIVIDNRTVMFDKENDPQILRATSPGKLKKYF